VAPSSAGLAPLQSDFLRAFFGVTGDFYLTGGAALIGFYGMRRRTNDLDLFSESREALDHVPGALSLVCDAIGATWREVRSAPYFRRFEVSRGDDLLQVDLVHEPTPQIHPDKPSVEGIRIDPLDEIMANKVCTLVGRAEIRDFWDLYQLVKAGCSFENALRDASIKEGGVDAESLVFVLQGVHWPTLQDAARQAGLEGHEGMAEFYAALVKDLAMTLLPEPGEQP